MNDDTTPHSDDDEINTQLAIAPAQNHTLATTSHSTSDDKTTGADADVSVVKNGDQHTGKNKKRKYIIEYNRDICIGAASCAAIAPLTFAMDDENKAYIIEEGDWDEEDIILAAAQSCPVFAIVIKDAETGKQIFPEEF